MHGPLPDGDERIPQSRQHAEADERRNDKDEQDIEEHQNDRAESHARWGL
jgi:hypothetical protein